MEGVDIIDFSEKYPYPDNVKVDLSGDLSDIIQLKNYNPKQKITFSNHVTTLIIAASVFGKSSKLKFPNTLKVIIFIGCTLNGLPSLPKTLDSLKFYSCSFINGVNFLLELKTPESIKFLVIDDCYATGKLITELPNFKKFKKLQIAIFSRLGLLSVPTLPQSIIQLHLDNNSLTEFNVPNKQIKFLDISNNDISSIILQNGNNLDKVEVLKLNSNKLVNIDHILPDSESKTLKKLYINDNENLKGELTLDYTLVDYSVDNTQFILTMPKPLFDICKSLQYELEEDLDIEEVCSICLDAFEEGHEIVDVHPERKNTNIATHLFHTGCLKDLFEHSPNTTKCPLCNGIMCKVTNGFGKLNPNSIVRVFEWN